MLDKARELLGRMTLPELIELLRIIADDLELRTMERAGEMLEDDLDSVQFSHRSIYRCFPDLLSGSEQG